MKQNKKYPHEWGPFFIFDVRCVLGIAFYAGQVVCESRGVLRDLNVTSSFLGSYQIHKHNAGTIIKQGCLFLCPGIR